MTFAKNLKQMRIWAAMSQAELAQEMSVYGFKYHQATVYKIEQGQRQVPVEEAATLAYIFGVTVDEMIGAQPPKKYSPVRIQQFADQLRMIADQLAVTDVP